MTSPEIVIGLLIVIFASFTMSLTGFGFALIATPLLLLLMHTKSVIFVNLLLSMFLSVFILWQSRSYIELKRIVPFAVGGILGLPLGAYILLQITIPSLQLLVGVLVLIFVIPLALGREHHIKKKGFVGSIAGFASGTLQISTSLSGPPVVLFALSQGWSKESFRANLVAYFLFLNCVTLPILILTGIITSKSIMAAFIYSPALIIGFYLGSKALNRLSASLFRRIAIFIVMVAGMLSIGSSII